jgi:metal-dependent amidase/aminoacylase/carboxypeptidase family protein
VSADFRFRGASAHAAAAPDKGRSALDGVEAMNHMVNLMREHVPAVAAGGMSIGAKGTMVAAKTMTLTSIDLFSDQTHIAKARAEFDQRRGAGFVYRTQLEGRRPALDYRK